MREHVPAATTKDCPAANPKPLVFPRALFKRSVVQMACDPAEARPERTSEQTQPKQTGPPLQTTCTLLTGVARV